MRAHEHRKVRVLRAQVCVMVAVAVYDGDAAFVMLFTHDAAGVHAERAHLVFERVRIVDELRLIKVLRQVIHDGVGHLHAHADVHLVVGERDAEALAFILQPLGAAAAGRHDDVRAVNIPSVLAGDIVHANCAAVFHDHVFRRGGAHEREILMLHEPFVHVLEHDGGIFRAHVAHGAAHQVDVVAACLIGDLRNLWVALAVHGIRRAETDVNGIRIVDECLCFRFRNVFCDVAAHLVREGELAVRKRACTCPTAHDGAGVAAHAFARDARRAFALRNGAAAVHQQYFLCFVMLHQLERGEDARRARADDDRVICFVHVCILLV